MNGFLDKHEKSQPSNRGWLRNNTALCYNAIICKLSCFSIFFLVLLVLTGTNAQGAERSDEWVQIDTVDGVELFRSVNEEGDLLPFKAVAEVDIAYQKIVMALVDAENKSSWAPKLKSITIHNEISPNRFEYSEYYETPWPFSDREFLLDGRVEYLDDRVVFSARNSSNTELADDDHLVANIGRLEVAVIPLSLDRTRISFIFIGDLGGWIPGFVKNIIQQKWPVRFIQAMESYINTGSSIETPRYQALIKQEIEMPTDENTTAPEINHRADTESF
jgi:hypothetical protein